MSDIIERIGKSVIQHGKSSNRVYLIKLYKDDFPKIINQINELAKANQYSKIFAKVPEWARKGFELKGYKKEAYIPNFYEGKEDVFFMARYLDPFREKITEAALIEEVLEAAKSVEPVQTETAPELENNFNCDILTPTDAPDMTAVYKKVFETYPFPIHNIDYLVSTMQENIVYFGIRDKDRLVAISSCEMDVKSKNVEMTDFATLPEYRGKGLASFLLEKMGEEMRRRGIITAYTIARAISYGMNITFAKHKYKYTGMLINNTNISGGIESMNVWYKALHLKKEIK